MGIKKLTIYFTSDLHGYMYPTDYRGGGEKDVGLFKCAHNFKKDGNTLVIDGGDNLQGSAFAAFCHDSLGSPRPLGEIMNRCGYDYVTLGNHDFNFGPAYLGGYRDTLNARCVCENVRREDGESVGPREVRVLANGLRVGIVGILTDYVNIWEKPENLRDFAITDPFEAAQEALEALRDQVDLTVCIYHGGFERDLDTGRLLSPTTENIGYRLCSELDFDVLLTGHQHMSVAGRDLFGTYVVQPMDSGRELHRVEVSVADGRKKVESMLIGAGGTCDEALLKEFSGVEDGAQRWLREVVGHLDRPLPPAPHLEMAAYGSGIADLFNRVQLDVSGAQISAVSLANEIAGFPQTVRRKDILTTYPYTNTLAVLKVTGAVLRAAMERSAEYFAVSETGELVISDRFLRPKVEHYNYDYYAGVRYVIDARRPAGERITELTFGGKAVEDTDEFTLCMNNYRASGSGDYPMYQGCGLEKEINTEMSDLIMAYFERTSELACKEESAYRVIW
ncbi:MAG: bifunctional metallophosphatase/5'-nucleotidase [Clostridia bacterium]|nr:bifunctional metallophosphatase/5'-nucleotidase [Clostridia bacterium]